MADSSDRLHLIQRAAKRLGTISDSGMAAVRDLNPLPESDAADVLERQEPIFAAATAADPQPAILRPAAPHAQPHAQPQPQPVPLHPPATVRRIRLNFSELRRNGMITPDNMTSSISHEFRTIKRKLLAAARDQKSQALINNLVMVTSALPGEGKTFTASNLAFSLAAERDLHVLLIDGDVIHPSVGALFEPSDGKGLTDLLNGNCKNVSDVLYRCSDISNLSVIFAGKRDEASPELISSRRMADLCAEFSNRYSDRVIVIDTPPVLASSEPANIAQHVHQIVMVVAAGQPSRTQVTAALEQISSCRNISLVFNKAPKWHQVQGDSYYYYGGDRAAGS